MSDWNEVCEKRGVVETPTVGNEAAMREALVWMSERMNAAVHDGSFDCYEALRKIEAALSAPARQCDVGTAEKQEKRFQDFCDGHSSGIGGMCDGNCPCFGCVDGCHCLCKWAQAPYVAEEGAGE